jgi:hypothetical protein
MHTLLRRKAVSHYFACGIVKNQYCRTNSGIAAILGGFSSWNFVVGATFVSV